MRAPAAQTNFEERGVDEDTVGQCGCWMDGTLCPPCAAALGAHMRRDLNASNADEDTLRLPLSWVRQATAAERLPRRTPTGDGASSTR